MFHTKAALTSLGAWLILLVTAATNCCGQGVLIWVNPHSGTPAPLPRPIFRPDPRPAPVLAYRIKELAVNTKVVDQIAQVQVTQQFVNTGSQQMEVSFVFPLPYDGAIDRMTFLVDGKEYDAKLMDAKAARGIYESHVRANRDPALLEWIGNGLFKTSVFPVPAGATRVVTLRFSQLLRKDRQLTDFLYPLAAARYTSQPIEKLILNTSIESSVDIKNVYSPTYAVNIQRPDSKHAVVRYEASNVVPTSDFRLLYDVGAEKVGASVIAYRPDSKDDGYFVLLASPEIKAATAERPKKTVVLVVDRSGSMTGPKIDQAKEALRFVVNNLREGDLFNIVAYDSAVESFRPELQTFNDETRKAALGFVEGLYAGGSTNIDGALSTALSMIKDSSRPNYVLFMTDGQPTVGEKNEQKIAANATKANVHRARIINFGVGYDLNSRLLDRLARTNFGTSEYVRPDEQIEAAVGRLYARVSSPVMTEVAVMFDVEGSAVENGPAATRIYPRTIHDLFEGEQLVLVGRYKRSGAAKVTLTGKIGNEKMSFDFPANLVSQSGDQSFFFVEKLWATRRIGEIIDELDLSGQNEELIKELVSLSTKHGILTPYTAFLADENAAVDRLSTANSGINFRETEGNLRRLQVESGRGGVAQRFEKGALKDAELPAADSKGYYFDGAKQQERAQVARGIAMNSDAPRGAPGGVGGPPGSGQFAGGRAGGGGAMGGIALEGQFGKAGMPRLGNSVRNVDTDGDSLAYGCQNIGKETLYKRGKIWVANSAANTDLAKDKAKIKELERFSDEYFKLVSGNNTEENAILACQQEGEELLVNFRGQTYYIK
jgi:Ca-activated chloride channel homolog